MTGGRHLCALFAALLLPVFLVGGSVRPAKFGEAMEYSHFGGDRGASEATSAPGHDPVTFSDGVCDGRRSRAGAG